MDKIAIRELNNEKQLSPSEAIRFCVKFSNLAAENGMREQVVNFETQKLKHYRELFEGAVFAYGLSHIQNGSVLRIILKEDSDYDLCLVRVEEKQGYTRPIQMKRLVSKDKDPKANLDSLVASLRKYGKARGLTVVIYAEDLLSLDLSSVVLPENVEVEEIYIFGSNKKTKEFCIFGELRSRDIYNYKYKLVLNHN